MDTLNCMRVFAKVVELGSFAAAAERLGVARSVVSKQVVALEERLGVRLINRTTRTLHLTEAGAAYLERCNAILAEVESLESSLGALAESPRGLLRVSAPVSFAISHLGPVLAGYRRQFPEVGVELAVNDRQVDIVEEGYDLALRIARKLESSLVGRRLATARMVLCAAPDYLARRGTPQRLEDLAGHDCIGYTYWGSGDDWQLDDAAGRAVTVRVKPTLRVNNGDVIRAAALEGEGVIFQPSFLVGDDLRAGRLVELLPGYQPLEIGIYAVYPHRKYLSAKVRTFVDYLVERFAQVRF